MNHLLCPANIALHLTTPVEHAVAPFNHQYLLTPVAPATAHQVATLDPLRGVVALATVRSLDAQLGVAFTEWWGGFVVDEVLQIGRFVLRIVGSKLEVVLVATVSGLAFAVDAVAVDAVADFLNLWGGNRMCS